MRYALPNGFRHVLLFVKLGDLGRLLGRAVSNAEEFGEVQPGAALEGVVEEWLVMRDAQDLIDCGSAWLGGVTLRVWRERCRRGRRHAEQLWALWTAGKEMRKTFERTRSWLGAARGEAGALGEVFLLLLDCQSGGSSRSQELSERGRRSEW